MPTATRRPDAAWPEAPADALAGRGSHVQLADASGLQLGPIGLTQGTRRILFLRTAANQEQTPKRVGPAGERGQAFLRKWPDCTQNPQKKSIEFEVAPRPEIAESAGKPTMVTVLYSTERPGGPWSGESFVIGPVCGRPRISSPVRHARPCDLAGSSHAP